jgi:hypothetical protein
MGRPAPGPETLDGPLRPATPGTILWTPDVSPPPRPHSGRSPSVPSARSAAKSPVQADGTLGGTRRRPGHRRRLAILAAGYLDDTGTLTGVPSSTCSPSPSGHPSPPHSTAGRWPAENQPPSAERPWRDGSSASPAKAVAHHAAAAPLTETERTLSTLRTSTLIVVPTLSVLFGALAAVITGRALPATSPDRWPAWRTAESVRLTAVRSGARRPCERVVP